MPALLADLFEDGEPLLYPPTLTSSRDRPSPPAGGSGFSRNRWTKRLRIFPDEAELGNKGNSKHAAGFGSGIYCARVLRINR